MSMYNSSVIDLVKKFINRIRKGEVRQAIYLSYFYSYLTLYDLWFSTKFAHSQSAEITNVPKGGTGNFPSHPWLVKKFLSEASLSREDRLVDVGCGSGMVLHVAHRLGFVNLDGVEYSEHVLSIARQNLSGKRIGLYQADAREFDLTGYSVISFFNPFRGELAEQFFLGLPPTIRKVIVINADKCIEPILTEQGFFEVFSYRHPIYENFNGKVYKR